MGIQTTGKREKDTKNSKKMQYGIQEFHPDQAAKRWKMSNYCASYEELRAMEVIKWEAFEWGKS